MASSIGQATCPECGHLETVMSDGRKYYIKCSADNCRVFTNFQAKAAKLRIQNRLIPVTEPEPPPKNTAASPPEKPSPKPDPTPARAGDRFDSLDDLF